MKKSILAFGVLFTAIILTSFNEPKTEKVTITKTTTELGGDKGGTTTGVRV